MRSLLAQAGSRLANQSLKLEPDEFAVLITDTYIEPDVRETLLHELSSTGANVRDVVVSFDEGNVAIELPDPDAVAGADAVLAAVSRSLTYNRHLAQVRAQGGRVLSMPRITRETLERFAQSDVDAMLAVTRHVAAQVEEAKSTLELRSPTGTRLSLDISESETSITDGVVQAGEVDQIPAGIVSVVGKRARGEIVITGPVSVIDKLDAPIHLRIEDGVIVSIEGGASARQLEDLLDGFDDREAARHCPAEVGIGTNPSVNVNLDGPFVPEYARATGMVHVGFGDDHLFPGGTVVAPIHGDFLLPDAVVWLDGTQLRID